MDKNIIKKYLIIKQIDLELFFQKILLIFTSIVKIKHFTLLNLVVSERV